MGSERDPPSRDPEDEVYLVSSTPTNVIVMRDEAFTYYSLMSEYSNDSRYNYEISSTQAESVPTSPIYRCQKVAGFTPSPFTNSHQTHHRGTDAECRFPSSASDICHLADLRKAALLRSANEGTAVVEERAVVNRVDEFGMAEHEKQKSCSNSYHEFERELGV